jgi:hypothetical protein
MSKCNCRVVEMEYDQSEGVCYCEDRPVLFQVFRDERWDIAHLENACFCRDCARARWRYLVRGRVLGKGLLAHLTPDPLLEGY